MLGTQAVASTGRPALAPHRKASQALALSKQDRPVGAWHNVARANPGKPMRSAGTRVALEQAMLRAETPLLLLLTAFGACSEGQTGAVPDSGSTVVTPTSGDAGGGLDAAPEGPDCSGLQNAAARAVAVAITSASDNLACANDSDCAVGPAGSDCSAACNGPITTQVGAAAVQSTIDHVNATTCAASKKEGCPPPIEPPCAPGPLGIACVQGACANFPPAAWASFAFDQQPGGVGFSTPPTCAAGTTCSLWTVTPDAHVAVIDPQGTHAAMLSATDFATVDGIMRSMAFRQSEMTGVVCDPSPGGQVISFDESRSGAEQGQDVTGCVLAGPSGNGLQGLYDVVKAY